MLTISAIDELREQIRDWRAAGDHIAMVPTMGNLHAGHLSLIGLAKEHGERVVVSIFVNPTQFSAGEDYEKYPRTLDRDVLRLKREGVHLLFTPTVETIYPFGIDGATSVTVPILGDNLCGSFRPGHFNGVTSVVSRLFSLVQPDVAVFGQKDYQQQLIIRRMTEDLNIAVRIVTGETVREKDGLALSSRNQYLDATGRAKAPELYNALQAIGEALQDGSRDFAALEKAALQTLSEKGIEPDYINIRRAADLDEPDRDCDELVILGAVHIGTTRLIDNIVVSV